MSFIEKIKEKLKARKNYREENSGQPVEMPVGFRRPPTLQEQIARFVRSEQLRQYAMAQGVETFEEAEDFNVEDEFEDQFTKNAPWEEQFEGQFEEEASIEAQHFESNPKNPSERKKKAPKKQAFKEEAPKPKGEDPK